MSTHVIYSTCCRLLIVIIFLVAWAEPKCQSGGGPENVFLLVNPSSRDSLTVANHYIDLRKLPPQNVFYLDWRRNTAATRGSVFRKEILQPALEAINRRKLGGQIDYLVYSCDYPWRITFEKDFPNETFPPSLKPVSSLTGATYLWSFVMNQRKEMFGLTTNFYFSSRRSGITLTRAFKAQHYWNADGRRTTRAKGISYLLSTMLGVTYGRGNSVNEIVRYLESAQGADGAKPRGTIYYVKNNSPRSTPRHDDYPQAVAELKLAGVHAEIETGNFLQNKLQVMGVTCGAPLLKIASSGCLFQPGALGDNLTSAGGNLVVRKLDRPDQTPLSEFLRFGCAGACGTVVEPLNIPHKFPSPYLHVHYARGCSMAESFYQSIAGPYQQLIVGDPLCQPWADLPEVAVKGITDKQLVSDTVKITPSAKISGGKTIKHFDFYLDGNHIERCQPGGEFSLDTKTLADGSHEVRVVATDNTAIETQGRWIGEMMVKNGLDAIQLSLDKRTISPQMKTLILNVASSAKAPVVVFHNGRELGKVARGTGALHVAVDTLGTGPITLLAETQGDPSLRSRPLRVVLP